MCFSGFDEVLGVKGIFEELVLWRISEGFSLSKEPAANNPFRYNLASVFAFPPSPNAKPSFSPSMDDM